MSFDHVIVRQSCPWCEHLVDRTSGFDGRGPDPGDAIFCVECAQAAILTRRGRLRRPTKPEQLALDRNPHAQMLVAAIRNIERKKCPALS
jgi:hypothetical protein